MTRIAKIIGLLSLCFLEANCCFAQNSSTTIEKTAFDFYASEIYKKPKSYRVNIVKKLQPFSAIGNCLKTKFQEEKKYKQYYDTFETYHDELDLSNIDRKKFKVLKEIPDFDSEKSFVQVSAAYNLNERIFVSIDEFIEHNGKKYTFEFDKNGKIIDWCQTEEYLRYIEY